MVFSHPHRLVDPWCRILGVIRILGLFLLAWPVGQPWPPAACRAAESPTVAADGIVLRGTLPLPDSGLDAAGNTVAITGLSGVAWLGDDRYVAVMDNSRHLLLFRMTLTQTGKPVAVDALRIVTLSERHDYEDVVPCPPAVTAALCRSAATERPDDGGPPSRDDEPCVLVCEEDTPAIRAFSLTDGRMLGALRLPKNLSARRPNRGLESLAVESDGAGSGMVWTANEEAVSTDGPPAAVGSGTVVRLTRLPLAAAGWEEGDRSRGRTAPPAIFQAAYAVDPPHPFVPVFAGQPLSGLVAMVALGHASSGGEGRLLALERSGAPGLPPFASRIYLVDVARAVDVSGVEGNLSSRKEAFVPKRLLWADSLGVNLEGLCLGPRLADGNRALIAIADNGGIGTPNQVVGLAWVTPAPAIGPALVAVAVVLLTIAIIVGRLTSP